MRVRYGDFNTMRQMQPAGGLKRESWRTTAWLAAALCGGWALLAAQAGARVQDPQDSAPALRYPGLSLPNAMLDLSFVYAGTIAEVPVKEGQPIRAGQVLIRQDDEVQRLSVEAQKLAADDTTEREAAQKKLDLSALQLQKVRDADQQKAARPLEVEQAQIDKALREIELRAIGTKLQSAKITLDREKAVLERMSLKSPIDGVVAQVNVEVGEAVDGLQPVMHVVSIDPLWMDVYVPVAQGIKIHAGDSALVYWRDVELGEPSMGKVMLISPLAQPDSSEIAIRLEIANPDNLPARMHAEVEFPAAEPTTMQAADGASKK